jgi:hypothetical protein
VIGFLQGVQLPATPAVDDRLQRFVRNLHELDGVLARAKQMPCPYCRRSGMVIGHGLLVGYSEHSSDQVVRGRRFVCSRRFRRAGCGRTFSVLIASVIARFTVRTGTLSRLLIAIVGGLCPKAAWERHAASGLSLRSGYRLWRRILHAQSHLRTTLCTACPPPSCTDPRPPAQFLAHMQRALGPAECLFAAFQLAFQRHLFG